MKKDFVMPMLVLSLICLVISGVLAFTNSVTEPIIVRAAAEREEEALHETIPEADDFERIAAEDLKMADGNGIPASIREVYRTTNDAGYVFVVVAGGGYGGDIKIMCGISPGGRIIRSKVLEHAETKGIGSKITESPFNSQFEGIDSSAIDSVDAITNATKSSVAYIGAIRDVLEMFEIIRGEGYE